MAERHKKFLLKQAVRGQELVEFAIIVPVLVLILFGVLDLGRVFFGTIAITNAARVGARAAVLSFDPFNNTIDINEAVAVANSEAQAGSLDLPHGSISVTCLDALGNVTTACNSGNPVQVTVRYNFDLIITGILGANLQITRSAEMMLP